MRVGELVAWGFLDVTWGITNIIAAVLFMAYINWRLALVMLAIIPALMIVAGEFKRHILERISRSSSAKFKGDRSL